MRLCTMRGARCTPSLLRLVTMQKRRYTPSEVEEIILKHAKPDGNIDFLFLDFEGQYTPICNRDEARLAAVLLSLYHNNANSPDVQVFRARKTL